MEGKWWSEKDGKVTIVKLGLIRFLTRAGYAKLPSKESFRLIQNEGNVVREVSIFAIRDFILDFLQENDQLDVMKEFVKSDYLNKVVIESLPTTEIDFHRDSKDKCFLYFQNYAVEITKDSFTLVKYENLEKPIWQDWKIDRNINGSKYTGCLFEDFIQKVTTHSEFTEKQHQERIKSLESIMGYLIHRFRSRAAAKAIVLTDMTLNEDGIANGRTGKGYTKTKKQGRRPGEQASALALILQRIESIVFLDHIVPRILKELPGVTIWTIHDSILTPKRDSQGNRLHNQR